MIPAELLDDTMADMAAALRHRGEPFAIATVIRTVGATAAKPGAKALLLGDGSIAQGWIGGGCVRGALKRAAARAMETGAPQVISLHPDELLAQKGVSAGQDVEGVQFARNGCPSKGSMDIFVEPVLPQPELVILGESPVAGALADLTARFHWSVTPTPAGTPLTPPNARRMIVVASQGMGDIACLTAALLGNAEFIGFVGSRAKFAALRGKLIEQGFDATRLDEIHAPVGLAIDAVTPDEIALSILAQLTAIRRAKQRDTPKEAMT
ncbi:MAG: XdhC family protein [Paracoccaceae bacterium]